MDLLNEVFGTTNHVEWPQECARALLILTYGYTAVRLLGPRLFGRWAALDIVVSLIIGSNLSRALTGNAPLWGTLAATSLVLGVHWALAQVAARSSRLSHLIEGRSSDLIKAGAPDVGKLRRWSVSEPDVNEALRQRGLRRLDEADAIILEPSGTISVLRKD
jgi:uncharacterized membrane protein YcaP (DUF421 family)